MENIVRLVILKKKCENKEVLENANFAGFTTIEKIISAKVYILKNINRKDILNITEDIFFNPVTDTLLINKMPVISGEKIEIAYIEGVMDPVANTIKKVLSEYFEREVFVKTRKLYFISGKFDKSLLIKRVLSNSLIEKSVEPGSTNIENNIFNYDKIKTINLYNKNSKELADISKKMILGLNVEEMVEIVKYFIKLKRSPTDAEVETIAQTWSEHCVHKTFKGIFHFEGEIIDNLLKETIVKATEEINREDCLSVFKDNAGIVKIDKDNAMCIKVETHNHPSALEPYGGAATGLGGVLRDILGAGLGAKPVASIDVFCTGDPEIQYDLLHETCLHPRRILKGIVSGVRDYGNRMGVPTIGGALVVDNGYLSNPLVFVGSIGILPNWAFKKEVIKGDKIVLIGGKTGRDGLHGATFSSITLDKDTEKTSQGAVQIGNPIEEKKVLEAILRIRDERLMNSITDCGAGGLSSAIGEMGEYTGAKVRLENIPLKYEGLAPWEIWLSESQERMVLSASIENISRIFEICEEEETQATVIGEFNGDGKLLVFCSDKTIVNIDMDFLHNSVPRKIIKAKRKIIAFKDKKIEVNIKEEMFKLLSHYDIASKDWIIRQYDHQVQGKTVVTPFEDNGNIEEAIAPSDGNVILSDYDSKYKIVVGLGINPNLGKYDCYKMTLFVIEEALRNLVSAGGDPTKAVLLDNFSWGATDDEIQMGDFVLSAKACYEASVNYNTPFVSGKDSFNNSFQDNGEKINIPPTLLITAVSVSKKKSPSKVFNNVKDKIWAIGPLPNKLGGSYFSKLQSIDNIPLPNIDLKRSKKILSDIYNNLEIFTSIRDISDGGLFVAISEMLLGTALGADIIVNNKNNIYEFLFSESPSRFVVTTDKSEKLKVLFSNNLLYLGEVTDNKELNIAYDQDAKESKEKRITIKVEEIENEYFSKRF